VGEDAVGRIETRIPKSEIRINDEARMTKNFGIVRASSFGIDSGFGFRHSDFYLAAIANE